MIDLIGARMELVIGIVFVANTPAYLFKRLRHLFADISRRIPLDRAVHELQREIAKASNRDLHRVAYMYALFIVMSYYEYSQVKGELGWVRTGGLRWIEELVSHYERTVVPSNSITVDIPPQLIEPTHTISVSANNNPIVVTGDST